MNVTQLKEQNKLFLAYRVIVLSYNYRFFTSCRPCYRINATHLHAQSTSGGKWQTIVKSDKNKDYALFK